MTRHNKKKCRYNPKSKTCAKKKFFKGTSKPKSTSKPKNTMKKLPKTKVFTTILGRKIKLVF